MSLQPQPAWTIPDETARVARAAFPKGNAVMQVYDELGILYHDHDFAPLFAVHGQPAQSPARLMLITMFQFIRQYEAVCIEDLNVRGLAKSKLAKHMHDAGWSFFRSLLAYKTCWNRKHVAVIDRFYPSSRLCRHCGTINPDLQVGDRVWRCACGVVHDRDLNAATNIQYKGYRLLPWDTRKA